MCTYPGWWKVIVVTVICLCVDYSDYPHNMALQVFVMVMPPMHTIRVHCRTCWAISNNQRFSNAYLQCIHLNIHFYPYNMSLAHVNACISISPDYISTYVPCSILLCLWPSVWWLQASDSIEDLLPWFTVGYCWSIPVLPCSQVLTCW